MKHILAFIAAIFFIIITAYLLFFFPIYTLIGILVLIILVGVYDLTQKKHAILRNFPVIGHFRYLFESIGPEIHQYFIESDTDGKPLNKNQRTYVYSRAKLENDNHPFGTEHDLQGESMEWTAHSIYTTEKLEIAPRVKIGGKECTQPYEASLLNVSAMSYGSLSGKAIESLNLGAKEGNFYHNTGEGGISHFHRSGGDVTYQIGTGYFGCRDREGSFSAENFVKTIDFPELRMVEIKLSQGAKPGHGGVLPAKKNTEEIAKIRGIEPNQEVKSPNSHKEFDSPEGLLKFVQKLRQLSKGKPIGFKLCIGSKMEFEDICKAMLETGIKPDFITVDGAEGGTGAAPITFSDHVGMPWENALVFVDNTLKKYGLREEITVITSGKIIDGFDIFKALCLGADVCNSARAMMLALGCIQALECHMNTCPTGVATMDTSKMRGLVVSEKYIRVKNYHHEALKDFLALFSATGCKDLSDLNRSLIYKQINGQEVCFSERYPEVEKGI